MEVYFVFHINKYSLYIDDLLSFNNYATHEHKQVTLHQSRYNDLQLNPLKHEFHGTDSVRK
jgi:hypothetical protein